MEASRKRLGRWLVRETRESRLAFPAVTPGSFNKVGTVSRLGWTPGCPAFFEISGNTCWRHTWIEYRAIA